MARTSLVHIQFFVEKDFSHDLLTKIVLNQGRLTKRNTNKNNRKSNFEKQQVIQFRKDFQEAIQNLEKKYGCNISLGTLRYDSNEVRGKMTAVKGKTLAEKISEIRFKVGETVKVNHKKVDPESRFTILKINKKSIRIQNKNNVFHTIKLSPSLLELV